MRTDQLQPTSIIRSSLLSEPVEIISVVPVGEAVKVIGKGLHTGQVHEPILNAEQVAALQISPAAEPFDGDAGRVRLRLRQPGGARSRWSPGPGAGPPGPSGHPGRR